jgi:two-component system cell cycle response regulator
VRVLIADDDALSLRILQDSLQAWNYDAVLARNGLEAWEILQLSDAPNLVILDWVMPGMDGLDICRNVRKMNRNYVYIILLTAKASREDIILGLESGADDYMIKPFYPEELKSRLKIGQRIIDLEQRIMRLARTDYLTGLLNRRAFMERLESENSRAQRENKPLSLIVMDIDHFKMVNDSYGHQVGDLVLQELAATISRTCRLYDFVGRYGGEEFIICLPGAGQANACLTAERMRTAIENAEMLIPDQDVVVKITASFGVASLQPGDEPNIDRLIKRADDALYKAKRQGRNRVVFGK